MLHYTNVGTLNEKIVQSSKSTVTAAFKCGSCAPIPTFGDDEAVEPSVRITGTAQSRMPTRTYLGADGCRLVRLVRRVRWMRLVRLVRLVELVELVELVGLMGLVE